MKELTVGITGASGFIGQATTARLKKAGVQVFRFVRQSPRSEGEIMTTSLSVNDPSLPNFDAIINLAGEPIIGRWTDRKRTAIHESRIRTTQLVAEYVAKLNGPCTLVSASAIGIYGPKANDECHENSPLGTGFLANVCRDWEAACDVAREAGQRVVHPRIGLVMDPSGGALEKMLTPFRLGLGGRVGSGAQWYSWITLDDAVDAIIHCLQDPNLVGPVNIVAPRPVTNATFTKALSQALRRPAFLPVPQTGLLALLGDMANETLLASQRVAPKRLQESGFQFRSPTIETAFATIL